MSWICGQFVRSFEVDMYESYMVNVVFPWKFYSLLDQRVTSFGLKPSPTAPFPVYIPEYLCSISLAITVPSP